ncbi:MAG: inositol monophosphatase [Limisphaerales bacterium]
MKPSLADSLALAVAAARDAGVLLRERSSTLEGVRGDQGKDLKLQADVRAEETILGRLRAASPHPILSEECGADAGFSRNNEYWVVDPLDGTLNYSRNLPLTCVSIGLWRADEPLLGVVHDFERGEVFAGIVGVGATCNDRPITVSSVTEPSKAVLATGFPSGRDYSDAALLEFCRKVQAFKKVRLLGSAALSLAWIAAGRLDAYAEDDIWIWDVAAGLALVAAAGGVFRAEPGSRPLQHRVFARTRGLRDPG